jgi:hypothetical protein
MKSCYHTCIFAGIALASVFTNASGAIADGISLAKKLNAPGPIALDGSGADLFFGQVSASPCTGEFDAVPADAGPLTQIATGTAMVDSYGICRGLQDQIVFAGPTVVYAYGSYDAKNIDEATAPCGDSCNHLVQNMVGGAFLGLYNGSAFYSANFSNIDSIPLTGGTVSTLASGYFVRSNSLDTPNPNYPANSQGLYYVDYYTLGVYRFDLKSDALTTVIQGNPDEGSILTDSKNVYWYDGQGIISGFKKSTCQFRNCSRSCGELTRV